MKSVLISGASVAGPALAYRLRQLGFEPTIIERAPELRPGGQAIDIRGVALDVAARMGILNDIRAVRTQMRGMSVLDNDGNEVWRSEEMTLSGGRFDNDDVEVLRDDLANILYERTRSDVEYIFGDSIVGVCETEQGAEVTSARGMQRTFDLLVGADGLHSNVRALCFGDESPFIRDLGLRLGIFSTGNFLNLDNWQVSYRDEKGGYLLFPARDNTELRVFLGFAAQPSDVDCRGTTQQKALVAQRCAYMGGEVPRLLKAMENSSDFYFGMMAQIHMDGWSKGRVVLLGDAAYCPSPMSGQGTSLALVGAYVLAHALSEADSDYAGAFARYETIMRPYVELNQALVNETSDGMVPEEALERAKNALSLREFDGISPN